MQIPEIRAALVSLIAQIDSVPAPAPAVSAPLISPGPTPVTSPPIVGVATATTAADLVAKIKATKSGTVRVTGDLGRVDLAGLNPTGDVLIDARGANLTKIVIKGSRNLEVRDATIIPVKRAVAIPITMGIPTLVSVDATSDNITINHCDIQSDFDAPNYRSWDKAEWRLNTWEGIIMSAPHSRVINNRLLGMYLGITIGFGVGDITSSDNLLLGVGQDAQRIIRGGDGYNVLRNFVGDLYQVDLNHQDLLQLYNKNGELTTNVRVHDNVLLKRVTYGDARDQITVGFEGNPQGIMPTTGAYGHLDIRRNIIATGDYNGVTIKSGANGVSVQSVDLIDNVAINDNLAHPDNAWLQVLGVSALNQSGNIATYQQYGGKISRQTIAQVQAQIAARPDIAARMVVPTWSQAA